MQKGRPFNDAALFFVWRVAVCALVQALPSHKPWEAHNIISLSVVPTRDNMNFTHFRAFYWLGFQLRMNVTVLGPSISRSLCHYPEMNSRRNCMKIVYFHFDGRNVRFSFLRSIAGTLEPLAWNAETLASPITRARHDPCIRIWLAFIDSLLDYSLNCLWPGSQIAWRTRAAFHRLF